MSGPLGCGRKAAYHSVRQAEAVIRQRLLSPVDPPSELWWYECPVCGNLHLSKLKPPAGRGGTVSMRTFIGKRGAAGAVVVVEAGGKTRPLDPREDLRCHSPTGFEWGYSGSGPAQLALAICAAVLRDDARAQRVYQEFKSRVIAGIGTHEWALDEAAVLKAIEDIEREAAHVAR